MLFIRRMTNGSALLKQDKTIAIMFVAGVSSGRINVYVLKFKCAAGGGGGQSAYCE